MTKEELSVPAGAAPVDRKAQLLLLAERCEREEPSLELDTRIALLFCARIKQFPRYTSSLDAAVTLIEDGVEWSVSNLYHVARAEVGMNFNTGPHYGEHKGAVMALALCAAALRALAHEAEHTTKDRA